MALHLEEAGELDQLILHIRDPFVRELLQRITTQHGEKLRIWPAALTVHHAYRSGFLEHILSVARSALTLGAEQMIVRSPSLAREFLVEVMPPHSLRHVFTQAAGGQPVSRDDELSLSTEFPCFSPQPAYDDALLRDRDGDLLCVRRPAGLRRGGGDGGDRSRHLRFRRVPRG